MKIDRGRCKWRVGDSHMKRVGVLAVPLRVRKREFGTF